MCTRSAYPSALTQLLRSFPAGSVGTEHHLLQIVPDQGLEVALQQPKHPIMVTGGGVIERGEELHHLPLGIYEIEHQVALAADLPQAFSAPLGATLAQSPPSTAIIPDLRPAYVSGSVCFTGLVVCGFLCGFQKPMMPSLPLLCRIL